MMPWHQIAARLTFAAGVVLIFFVMGAKAFAGAGMMLLILLACRQIEANVRQRAETERQHWQQNPHPFQPLD